VQSEIYDVKVEFTTQDTVAEEVRFKVVIVWINLLFWEQYKSRLKEAIGTDWVSFHWNLMVDPIWNVSDPYCVQIMSACAECGATDNKPTRPVQAREATAESKLDRGHIVQTITCACEKEREKGRGKRKSERERGGGTRGVRIEGGEE
jgi:hypothetical protein